MVVAGVSHGHALFDTFLAQKRAQADETASNIEEQDITTTSRNGLALARRGPDGMGTVKLASCGCLAVTFQNSVLQLRGKEKIRVPLHREDTKNIIAFNGEIFGSVGGEAPAESDTIWLLTRLDAADGDAAAITNVFSSLRGPWCIVYWHNTTRHLWFAKDVLGRRSLLIGFSSAHEGLLSIASVAPRKAQQSGEEWIDCPPGIYSIDYSSLSFERKQSIESRVNWKHHAWSDELSSTLFFLRRKTSARSGNYEDKFDRCRKQSVQEHTLHVLWRLLDRSVRCRVTQCNIPSRLRKCRHEEFGDAFVGVLFSGGLDSTLLSALIHRNLCIEESVDLYSVCFDNGNSPDRRAARSAVAELQRVCRGRAWRLIEIDVSKSELNLHRDHIETLIYPGGSDMDFNIGAALWFAARGVGRITSAGPQKCFKTTIYQSRSRIIFSGMGADELCGGYSRHRTIFKSFGEEALEESLRADILNLWRRNLGRDDRILSDHGRETRYPYLDEEFISQILRSPLRDIVDLSLSPGVGDKKCLRRLAKHLGLSFTAQQRKRAIQFGSRVCVHERDDEMIHASPL